MTVSVAGGNPCAAIASRISASSPSRVEAASQTGRVSPKRSRNSRPSASGGVGDVDVELEVAEDGGARRAQRGDARGVRLALRRNAGERRHHRARQRGNPRIAGRGPLRHPRVDQEDRNAALARERDRVRPQLGLHDQQQPWLPMREEAAYRERHVVRKPRLDHAIAEERLPRRASRRSHVRHEQRRIGIGAAHPVDERDRGARLAERDSVHPQNGLARRAIGVFVAPESLADVLAVARFAPPPPPEPQRQERQHEISQKRVERAHRQRR